MKKRKILFMGGLGSRIKGKSMVSRKIHFSVRLVSKLVRLINIWLILLIFGSDKK